MVCGRGRHGAFGAFVFYAAKDRSGLGVDLPVFRYGDLDAAKYGDNLDCRFTVGKGSVPQVDIAAPKQDENSTSTDLST